MQKRYIVFDAIRRNDYINRLSNCDTFLSEVAKVLGTCDSQILGKQAMDIQRCEQSLALVKILFALKTLKYLCQDKITNDKVFVSQRTVQKVTGGSGANLIFCSCLLKYGVCRIYHRAI